MKTNLCFFFPSQVAAFPVEDLCGTQNNAVPAHMVQKYFLLKIDAFIAKGSDRFCPVLLIFGM